MTRLWDVQAGALQTLVRKAELEKIDEYTDEEIRQAIVHTREDVNLLVSYLSSANRQLWAIRVALWVIAACAIYMVVRTII